jgi:hypothetical protein
MWDETTGDDDILCGFCGCEGYEECSHLLLLFDVTYSDCMRGKATEFVPQFADLIKQAFSEPLTAGRQVQWAHSGIGELWKNLNIDGVEDHTDFNVECSDFYKVIIEALTEAGGEEYPGRLVSSSGPYSESCMRLLHAEKPEDVCMKALSLVQQWLVEEQPKRPRRKQKRKGDGDDAGA